MGFRRDALKTIAAAAATFPAAAQHQHTDPPLQIAAPYTPQVFDAAQMKSVAALVDRIIPRTETPGASDAGVPAFIDRVLARSPQRRERFLAGLAEFAQLDEAERTAALEAALLEQASTPLARFLRSVKDVTVDGYYGSKEGLVEELGWHGNSYQTEFKGCTHPEHQS